MEPRMRAAPKPMIKDFIPNSELVQDEEGDTLILYLPDFMKEQLKVLLTMAGSIKISGERPLGNNTKEIFTKEVRIPKNCNTNAISAKFDKGILYVKQPKMIKAEKIKAEPPKEAPTTEKPAIEAPSWSPQKMERMQAKPAIEAPSWSPQTMEPMQAKPAIEAPSSTLEQTTTTQEPAYANGQDKQRNWKTDKNGSFVGATQKMNEEDNKKKETNEKTDKQEDAKGVTKNMEEEKKPPVEASGRSSAGYAENLPQQTRAEAKSDAVGELMRKPEESEQRNGDFIDSATDLQNESYLGKSRLEYYKQLADATITELNKPRQIMNLVIAASVGLAIGLYISCIFKSSHQPEM
ncbi:Alpha crystallin/Hsp20 domain [Dillenia turbinata]|uniref:Alpha crystallin/Hsp20 domain n=1 Tax=Dillenia turbinata TaxID=194707 RepID=A0AAN8V7Q1_9MAGN